MTRLPWLGFRMSNAGSQGLIFADVLVSATSDVIMTYSSNIPLVEDKDLPPHPLPMRPKSR